MTPRALPVLIALAGCADKGAPVAEGESFTDIVITPDTMISAVQHVSFTTSSEEDGWVEFGPAAEEGWRAAATSLGDGAWEATLLGLPAGSEAWITVGAGSSTGPTTTVTTDRPPAWLDYLETSEGTPSPGFLVMTVTTAKGTGPAILDTRGRPVWWYEASEELLGRTYPRARLGHDLDEVWFNAMGATGSGEDALVRVAIDGSTHESFSRPHAHHDFWLHDDGTQAMIQTDDREVEGETIYGDQLVEYAPSGEERQIWSVWDTLVYDPATSPLVASSWTIANHIEYVAASDTYVMSLRNIDTLVAFERATGTVEWTLGPEGTYVPQDQHHNQHGFDVLDDGILLFDNGTVGNNDSRAVQYRFGDGVADNVWEYHSDPALYSFIMGDAHLLENGNTRVTFSTMATVQEVDADGVLEASFSYEIGTILGFPEPWDTLIR